MHKSIPVRPLSRGRVTCSYHLYTGLRALPSTCAYLTRTPTGVLPPTNPQTTTLETLWPTSERSMLNRHRSRHEVSQTCVQEDATHIYDPGRGVGQPHNITSSKTTSERSLLNRHRSEGQSPERPVYRKTPPTFTTPVEGSDKPLNITISETTSERSLLNRHRSRHAVSQTCVQGQPPTILWQKIII